jgi:hypothetical protein
MRIMTLAAGLATGYVLGARAGREKYDQIAATARKVTTRTSTARADKEVTGLEPDTNAVTTPAVVPSIEQPAPAVAADKPRRSGNRRTNAVDKTATPNATDETPAMSTANLVLDRLPTEAAEADIVEQNTPVVDNSEEPALTPLPLESDPTDVREQRRSL